MTEEKPKKKEPNENILFIDSIIKDYDARVDEAIEIISELLQKIREIEFEISQLEKSRITNSGMFSPNDIAAVCDFDSEKLQELDKYREKVAFFEERYKNDKIKIENLKLLRQEVMGYNRSLKKKSSNDINAKKLNDSDAGIKLLEIQELERNRIASELHDSAVQNLTGLVHKSELCVKLFDIDETRARLELSSIIDVAKETIVEIREAIFDLRPVAIDDIGLADSISNFVNSINKSHKVAFIVYKEGNEYNIDETIEINLYRIAQEACNNIMKHSQASKASVLLRFDPDVLSLTVTDNGIGIPAEKVNESKYAKKNFGISIMRERANVLNGTFEILKNNEGGTEIRVAVPIIR